MTTQTVYGELSGDQGGIDFTATCTDDTWTELLDGSSGNTLSLDDILLGKSINTISGSYNAGGGQIRVRNTVTNDVKMLEFLAIVTEEHTREIEAFTVEPDDIIEAFTVATPT